METYRQFKQEVRAQAMGYELPDPRVHLCLYFHNGHHIKEVDLNFMKELTELVNVIPIIAKADTFTTEELIEVKTQLVDDAEDKQIAFFDCLSAIKVLKTEQPHSLL